MIRIGIDTGGTFTDAVVVDLDGSDGPRVLAKAKALTTKANLARGIGSALDALIEADEAAVRQAGHVALSTTLATNACVEGKGGRARLVLVGTTDEVLRRVDAQGRFGIPYTDVLTLPFKGTYSGTDVELPDWEAVYEANRAFFDEAESFGIASVYALNNGAIVEKDGGAWLRERFGKLVVEATTVAVKPNVIERGATALLNARLVPVIREFLDAIDRALDERGLKMPVSIVRSDGSLMSEQLALTRPVETILSGPAASVCGAQALAGAEESLIVDIGGTTSDVSIVHGSRPNRTNGIFIGGWKTQVPGVAIDTVALGGDTAVRYTKASRLELATRKVTPLCIAADRWPEIMSALERYYAKACADFQSRYEMFYLARDPGDVSKLTLPEQQLIDVLRDGPVSLFDERMDILGLKTERLENEGVVMRIGMTPTDAMHLKGDFDAFDARASLLGARCVLKSYRGVEAAEDDEQVALFADEIYDLARYRLFHQVAGAFISDRIWPGDPHPLDTQMDAIIHDAWLHRADGGTHPFKIQLRSEAKLVGIGAPTHVFLGEVAEALGAEGVVPDHAEVANAIGAAASSIAVEERVNVVPSRGSDGVVYGFQVRSAGDSVVIYDAEEALATAREMARSRAIAEARRRGAVGDVPCTVDETRYLYKSTGALNIVREWVVIATTQS